MHFLWINDQSESNHQIYQIKENGTLASRLLYLNLALRQGFYRILPERHRRRATMCQHDLDVGCEKWHSSHKKAALKEVRRMSFWKLLQRFKESPPHKGFMLAMKLLGFWSLVKRDETNLAEFDAPHVSFKNCALRSPKEYSPLKIISSPLQWIFHQRKYFILKRWFPSKNIVGIAQYGSWLFYQKVRWGWRSFNWDVLFKARRCSVVSFLPFSEMGARKQLKQQEEPTEKTSHWTV